MKKGSIKKLVKRKSFWTVMYAVYLSLILLSVQAFFAEIAYQDIRDKMDDSYTYHLRYHHDGVTTHYDVILYNTSKVGEIDLTYTTDSNLLKVYNMKNIKELKIDVKSMFEDEAKKVFKYDHGDITGFDMDYWFSAGDGKFTIKFDIDSSEPLKKLTFTKFPTPTSVLVDNQEWWQTSTNYSIKGNEITIQNIPTGDTTVIIDFNEANLAPLPSFTMTPEKDAAVNQNVSFDASLSKDSDGSIKSYLWVFGDSQKGSGKKTTHAYSKPGTYTIRLTVRDDDDAEAWIEKTLNVSYGADQNDDSDGLIDRWEWEHFESLEQDENDDYDKDNYPNGLEYSAGTDPTDETSYANDSDADGLDDLWEWNELGTIQYSATDDPDRDGADNMKEYKEGTDPDDPDDYPKDEEEDEEDKGLLGMGKYAGIDFFVILIIIMIVIVLIAAAVITRSRKTREEAAARKPAEEKRKLPARRPAVRKRPARPSAPARVTAPEVEEEMPMPEVVPEPVPAAVEEAPVEIELEEEETGTGAQYCPVCGEPVDVGMPNCPVCETPL